MFSYPGGLFGGISSCSIISGLLPALSLIGPDLDPGGLSGLELALDRVNLGDGMSEPIVSMLNIEEALRSLR
jgi:hypothetical protein